MWGLSADIYVFMSAQPFDDSCRPHVWEVIGLKCCKTIHLCSKICFLIHKRVICIFFFKERHKAKTLSIFLTFLETLNYTGTILCAPTTLSTLGESMARRCNPECSLTGFRVFASGFGFFADMNSDSWLCARCGGENTLNPKGLNVSPVGLVQQTSADT